MPAVVAAAIVGLFGTAVISPAQPVCRAGESCTKPAAGMTLVFTSHRSVVSSCGPTRTWSYRIQLAPGTYTVRVAGNRIARVDPLKVAVRRGLLLRRNLAIDVGIR